MAENISIYVDKKTVTKFLRLAYEAGWSGTLDCMEGSVDNLWDELWRSLSETTNYVPSGITDKYSPLVERLYSLDDTRNFKIVNNSYWSH